MENNNWYDNQSRQNSPYQSYYQPASTQGGAQNGGKRFSFGQLLACLLAVVLLSGCISVGAFILLDKNRQEDVRQEASAEVPESSTVIEEPPAQEKESAPREEDSNPIIQKAEAFVPSGDASRNLSLARESASAINDPTVNMIQNCMATAVGITTKVPASAYYNVYGFGLGPNTQDDADEVEYGAGSGIILTEDGFILTCAHVISGGQSVYVCLQDGTEYEAQVVGSDKQTDIAVLKIDAKNLPAATLGNSQNAAVGETVYAVGNPLGEFISSVSTGIISGLDRTLNLDGQNLTLIQTDAAVNSGNSGGGLFNSRGELIGVVNAKTKSVGVEGLGFAIPIDSVKTIIADLMDLGFVSGRPYLGISLQDVYVRSNPNAHPGGFQGYYGYGYTARTQIAKVEEGSPAEQAGLQVGDIILGFNEEDVSGASALTSMIFEYKVGDVVTITVLRGDDTETIRITLGERSV